jgi:hypothetical protein
MAVNYSTTLKTNRMQLVADLIASKVAAASTGTASAGSIIIQDAASVVLATIALPTTPFTISGSAPVRATLQGVPLSDTSADATGTASKAEIRNNGGTAIVTGLTVGSPSGFDINLTSTAITVGQTVTITAGTIDHG